MTSNRPVSEMVERDRHVESCPLHWLPKGHAGAKCWCNLASSQAASDDVVERVAKFLEPQIMAHTGKDWEWRQNEERKYAHRLIEETGLASIPPAGGVEEPTDAMIQAGMDALRSEEVAVELTNPATAVYLAMRRAALESTRK